MVAKPRRPRSFPFGEVVAHGDAHPEHIARAEWVERRWPCRYGIMAP
jgi:hypothetical protein